MRRAIDILPADIKPFFVERREEIVNRAIDPDLWRDAGWDEAHNHFINFGAPELGAVSVYRAAARLHRRTREVRAGELEAARHAALAPA